MNSLLLLSFMCAIATAHCGHHKECSSEWRLVFRGVSGIGKKVYSAWTRPTPKRCRLNDGCLAEDLDLTMVKAPNKHLVSPLIKKWRKLNIVKVKLVLFSQGRAVVDMIFNGTGSSSTNWFSTKRLLENSFDDLYSDGCQRTFSMRGSYAKKFLVAQESYICNRNYHYWMAVVDYKYRGSKSRFCNWERHSSYPVFLYAEKHHKSKFYYLENGGYDKADILAIYIKTKK